MRKTPQRRRSWNQKYGPEQYDAVPNPDGTYTLGAVRDFTYSRNSESSETWIPSAVMRPNDVVRSWLLLEPFTSWDAIAHPYFIFEYSDGSTMCVTIEGKRLAGESYSGIKGIRNEYELGYVWMTERDALTMPLTHGAKALYLYPLTLSPDNSGKLMHGFLYDTHKLFETPEFYHTVFNNCTVHFARILRREQIHRAPFDVSWYLPGWIDRYLARLRLIDVPRPLRTPARDLVARQDEVWEIIEKHPDRALKDVFLLIDR